MSARDRDEKLAKIPVNYVVARGGSRLLVRSSDSNSWPMRSSVGRLAGLVCPVAEGRSSVMTRQWAVTGPVMHMRKPERGPVRSSKQLSTFQRQTSLGRGEAMLRMKSVCCGSAAICLVVASQPAMATPEQPRAATGVDGPRLDSGQLKGFPGRSRYLDTIQREAITHGLPPAIADAVVRIESGYDPSAIGQVGEIGLMQVRPTTAAMMGFEGAELDLADPATNIRYGVAYLAKAWRLAGGDLCRTLTKYRAGHNEESMSPLSIEYCHRARLHLAALGWSPDGMDASAGAAQGRQGNSHPVKPVRQVMNEGPRMISVRSANAFFAANRVRLAEAFNRVSVMRKR
jgi:hypothetical protein